MNMNNWVGIGVKTENTKVLVSNKTTHFYDTSTIKNQHHIFGQVVHCGDGPKVS